MEVYFENQYGQIRFDDNNKVLIVTFKPINYDLEIDIEEKLKDFMLKYLEAFMHYRPSRVLLDYRDFNYVVSSDFVNWVKENIVKKTVANGLKRLAQVYPKELVAKLDLDFVVRPIIENVPGPIRRNFEDYNEAYQWLLKDKSN